MMQIVLNNNLLELLPERALWWPDRRLLMIADVHLGKDQVFRRHGIAIPGSVLHSELEALSRMVGRYRPEQLLVLGDWVHAPPSADDDWPETVRRWRTVHGQLSIDLVLGNHDRRLDAWLSQWRMGRIDHALELDGLQLIHAVDAEQAEIKPGVSGHWHPCVHLRSGRESLRMPAFALRDQHLILPSFGRFTGGMDGLEQYGWQLLAVAGQRIAAINPP